jgi:DeoR/GlpR family transcriptional regulator of sugar metabolism
MATEQHSKRSKTTLARRQFILKKANLNGSVSFDEIRKGGFKDVGWQSLKGDAKLFKNLNLGVQLLEGEGKFVLGSPAKNVPWTYNIRKEEDSEQKEAIGELAVALIWGPKIVKKKKKEEYIWPSDKIQRSMEPLKPNSENELNKRFWQYWHKKHRYCAIDAGTTTAMAAQYLTTKKPLSAQVGAVSLTVVTNAPKVEEVLQPPSVDVEVVMVGGQLRKDTMAHTGLLCEQCLDSWKIRPDLTMVGTTSLTNIEESKEFYFMCDSPDEARTKGVLLQRADIRCVLMSSSKCARYRSSAFIFASLSPDLVDLVITDEQIKDKEVWDRLHKSGVNVLIAETG